MLTNKKTYIQEIYTIKHIFNMYFFNKKKNIHIHYSTQKHAYTTYILYFFHTPKIIFLTASICIISFKIHIIFFLNIFGHHAYKLHINSNKNQHNTL
jgi:hypothetical protein